MVTDPYKKAVQRLWQGRATVTVREGVVNEATGRTEPVERVAASNLACRMGFSFVRSARPVEEAARVTQAVTLYLDPGVKIPEGSKVTVTQNGVTTDYERSGKAAVYTCHQEVPLTLWTGGRWA